MSESADRAGSARSYFDQGDEQKALGLFRILGEPGAEGGAGAEGAEGAEFWDIWSDSTRCRTLYRGMLQIRVMDERLMALQRQGRIGFYGEARGQEAAVVG